MIADKNQLRLFVERYLELAGELQDKNCEAGAYFELGLLEQKSVLMIL